MTTRSELELQVQQRAHGRCEYCRMHQSLQGATFHIEHVLPLSQGGSSVLENLAWACPSCNLHKSNRVVIHVADQRVRLFNPRRDRWSEHFRWERYEIMSATEIGRVTAETLGFNAARRILIRQAEQLFGLFPPTD